MNVQSPTIIAALAISTSVAHADPHDMVCRGDMYSAVAAADPYYKDATWIGKCFFKSNTAPAKLILEECHYRRPCTVRATILDSGEIVQVRSVKLDGSDKTCRGALINTDKHSGDTAKIGPCRFTDLYPGVARAILDACRYGRPCVVRARVNAGEITHVYSAAPR
jgi:hypothetical protein